MSDTATPNLDLEYLDASQAQPEAKINDAWNKIDAAVAGAIVVKELGDSPAGEATNVRTLYFAGALVEQLSDGGALVTIPSSSGGSGGGGGSPISVTDGVTLVSDVTQLRFFGSSVTEESAGVALVSGDVTSGGGGGSGAVFVGTGPPGALEALGDLYFDQSQVPPIGYVQVVPPTSPSPTIDGTPATSSSWTGGLTHTINLTTSSASKKAILCISNEHPTNPATVASVTSASSLAWTQIAGAAINSTNNGGYINLEVWEADLTGALSGEVITVTLTAATDDATLCAFGVIDFDSLDVGTGIGLPAAAAMSNGGTTLDVAGFGTTVANELLLYVMATAVNNTGGGVPAGYSSIAAFVNTGGSKWSAMQVAIDSLGSIVSSQTVTSPFATSAPSAMIMIGIKGPSATQVWSAFTPLAPCTVAALPASATDGLRGSVTDAISPSFLGALVGGGAIKCPVFYNGVAWVSA